MEKSENWRLRTYQLPLWRGSVATTEGIVIDYLDSFMDPADSQGHACRTFVLGGQPAAAVDDNRRVIVVPADDVDTATRGGHTYRATIDHEISSQRLRLAVRREWVHDFFGTHAAFVAHASAVELGRRVLVFLGDRRAGKTTLLLDVLDSTSATLVTNDNLVCFHDGGVHLSAVPTFLKIRADVVGRFRRFLKARVAASHYNTQLFERYGSEPNAFTPDGELVLAPVGFGEQRTPVVRAANREVILVEVSFAPRCRIQEHDGEDFARSVVLSNLKNDLGYDRDDAEEGPLHELFARARTLSFGHTGSVEPLLEYLGDPEDAAFDEPSGATAEGTATIE